MTRKLTLTDEELEKAHAIVDMEKTRREEKLASFQAKFPLKKTGSSEHLRLRPDEHHARR